MIGFIMSVLASVANAIVGCVSIWKKDWNHLQIRTLGVIVLAAGILGIVGTVIQKCEEHAQGEADKLARETQFRETLNNITGGNSVPVFMAVPAIEGTEHLRLVATNPGRYPIDGLLATITYGNTISSRHVLDDRVVRFEGAIQTMVDSTTTIAVPIIPAGTDVGHGVLVGKYEVGARTSAWFRCEFRSRNGIGAERLRLTKVADAWTHAMQTRFKFANTTNQVEIEVVSTNYPRRQDGTISWGM